MMVNKDMSMGEPRVHLRNAFWSSFCATTLFTAGLIGGCGADISVGDTLVFVEPGAGDHVWHDIPEALASMQIETASVAPDGMWDVVIFIHPPWKRIAGTDTACYYRAAVNRVHVRPVDGPATADGCLPHELAHHWRYVESGRDAKSLMHDGSWSRANDVLQKAARKTWLRR